MPSADFCPSILPSHDGSSTKADGQISPGIAHRLSSHIPVASTSTPSGWLSGFESFCLLAQEWVPPMRFVYLGPGVRVPLPSDPTSRWQPLRFGSWFPPSGSIEDFHLQASAPCRAHTRKDVRPFRAVIGMRWAENGDKGYDQKTRCQSKGAGRARVTGQPSSCPICAGRRAATPIDQGRGHRIRSRPMVEPALGDEPCVNVDSKERQGHDANRILKDGERQNRQHRARAFPTPGRERGDRRARP